MNASEEPGTGGRRLAAMLTNRRSAGPITIAVLAVAVLTVAACIGSGATSGPSAVTTAPPSATPSVDPNMPVGTGLAPGGSFGPDVDPATGATIVEPQPGQLDVHPVAIDTLSASVEGKHVVVTAGWTSGVEPCYVLDTIVVHQSDHAFTITIREGHGPGDQACIEIAMLKAAKIDLGELQTGTYEIRDGQGVAAPIEVTVS
jgi:hypothetical protein